VTAGKLIETLRAEIKLKGLKTADEVRLACATSWPAGLRRPKVASTLRTTSPMSSWSAGSTAPARRLRSANSPSGLPVSIVRCWLAAGDTFRAAAREQLAVWGARNNVEVVSQSGGDPAAVVFDAVSAAKARGADVLIADTAGRLPTQSHLMEELKRVKRAQDKALPGAPHEVILIVDGTNGQNALAQVQAFDAAVGLTGLVVTSWTAPPRAACWWPSRRRVAVSRCPFCSSVLAKASTTCSRFPRPSSPTPWSVPG